MAVPHVLSAMELVAHAEKTAKRQDRKCDHSEMSVYHNCVYFPKVFFRRVSYTIPRQDARR